MSWQPKLMPFIDRKSIEQKKSKEMVRCMLTDMDKLCGMLILYGQS